MSFQGEISSLPLSDVVQNLVMNKMTGTLAIGVNGRHRYLQFKSGSMISYRTDGEESIHKWLSDKNIVPETQMKEAIRRHKRASKKSLGAILRDMRALDLDEYVQLLSDFASESICELLSYNEGTFEFREGDLSREFADPELLANHIEFSAQNLIMEAARRADDWENIRCHLPSESEIYFAPPGKVQYLKENAQDEITAEALGLLDGTRTLKQVIDQLPYSRFDALCCLANLIADKKIRRLDSPKVVERTLAQQDSKEAIQCLRVLLEREPNNREVLSKLAHLYEEQGQSEESAKYNKMLGISYFEDKDYATAKSYLSRSLQLNSRDIVTWQRLWVCMCRSAKDEDILAFGRTYIKHFKKIGLTEMVREHLLKMIDRFPQRQDLKIELAEACFALGEKREAIRHLVRLGQSCLRDNLFDEAEKVFARILKFDPKNKKATEVCQQIRAGKLQRRRTLRRRLARELCLTAVLIAALLFVVRELSVQSELFSVMRSVLSEKIMEEQRYDELIERLERVREDHPFSPTASKQIEALVTALQDKREHGIVPLGPQPKE